jgi:hypothetical protein
MRTIIHIGYDTETGETFAAHEKEDNDAPLHILTTGDGQWTTSMRQPDGDLVAGEFRLPLQGFSLDYLASLANMATTP